MLSMALKPVERARTILTSVSSVGKGMKPGSLRRPRKKFQQHRPKLITKPRSAAACPGVAAGRDQRRLVKIYSKEGRS